MKQKISSLILILTFAFTLIIPSIAVNAANSSGELGSYWFAYFLNSPSNTTDRYAEITSDKAYDGTHSLHVKKAALSSAAVYVQNLSDELEDGATYNVEFYLYNNGGATSLSDGTTLYYLSEHGKGIHNITIEDTDIEGWKKYSHQWTNTVGTAGSAFWFQFNGASNVDVYIDNVKVWKNGDESQTNVVNDNSFELGFGSIENVPDVTGFTAKYVNPADNSNILTQDADVYDIAYDTHEYYDGNASLYLKRYGNYTERVRQTKLISTEATSFSNGTSYTLTFYADKQFDSLTASKSLVYFGSPTAVYISSFTSVSENGWYKYSYTQTASNNTPLQFVFKGPMDIHIDAMSLTTASDPTENILSSGSFDVEETVYSDPYEPKNVIIDSWKRGDDGAAMILSWQNPSGDVSITDINVYDITDESNIVTLTTTGYVNTGSGAANEFYLGNTYADGNVHTFKLALSFGDGETREIVCQKKATAYASLNIHSIGKALGSGWSKYYNNNPASQNPYMIPAYFNIDREVSHSGNASYHLSSNRVATQYNANRPTDVSISNPWNTNNYKIRTYMGHNSTGMSGLEKNKTYRLKFWAKGNRVRFTNGGENVISLLVQSEGGTNVLNTTPFQNYMGTSFDWTQFSYDFTDTDTKANGYYRIIFDIPCAIEDLWIDDIVCYELDGTGGEITNKNFVTYGDFETYTAPVNVDVISAAAGDASAQITFEASAARSVYIYEKKTDPDGQERLKLRAIADPAAGDLTIGNLENGETYKFVYKTENANFVLSDAVEIGEVTPMPPAYTVTGFSLYKNGSEVTAITAAGDYTAKISVKNNALGDDFSANLIAALYDGYELKSIAIDEKNVAQTAYNADATEFEVTINVPQTEASDSYYIGVFLWDNFETMKPLSASDKFLSEN